jgi:hypothetical protein
MTTHTGMDLYIERTDLFIDGDWQPPLSTETYTVVSPATEEPERVPRMEVGLPPVLTRGSGRCPMWSSVGPTTARSGPH